MTDKTEAPMWAREEAARRLNAKAGISYWIADDYSQNGAFTIIADMIAKYEQPPVDPLLQEAREICAARFDAENNRSVASDYRSGLFDNDDKELSIALAALKRGMEIEREKSK